MESKAIKFLRMIYGVNQQELATRLKVSKSYIQKLEQGKLRISREILQRIAKAFDMSEAQLLMLEEMLAQPELAIKRVVGG